MTQLRTYSKFSATGTVAVLLLVLSSCRTRVQSVQTPSKNQESAQELQPIDVSMVSLISDPLRYNGKLIRTEGFLSLRFEDTALYLHQEDFRYLLRKNSLVLRLDRTRADQFKKLNLRYVIIEGVIRANGPEAEEWAGAIGDITRLQLWDFDEGSLLRSDCRNRIAAGCPK